MSDPNLEQLLEAASSAEPADRISFRDPIAGFGIDAVGRMSEWMGDERLGAFAVRVLERLARQPTPRDASIAALIGGLGDGASATIQNDAREALSRLGATSIKPAGRRSRATDATLIGKPGIPGRGYWAMHTWERTERAEAQRAYVWAELQRGRQRQGWGWDPSQDLRVIQELRGRGAVLDDGQKRAWRAHRMLTALEDSIQLDDIVIAVAMPEPDQVVVSTVIGPYDFDLDPTIQDYGHLLPIEVVAGPLSRHDERVSAALRHALARRPRLWQIDAVGGDVEDLLSA